MRDVDRLVLLGDLVELRQGPVQDALAAATGVLTAFAEALGGGREVVIVPGNHDHHLLTGWFERRASGGGAPPLGLESSVDRSTGDPLAQLARALEPVTVRICYPGVWLRDDCYATHGHYIDRHTTVPMFERLGAGAMARMLRSPVSAATLAEDYEAVLTPIYAWIHAVAQTGGPERGRSSHGASTQVWEAFGRGFRGKGVRAAVRRRALRAGIWTAITALNRAGLGPVSTDLTGSALRRASLVAFGDVLAALRVDAAWTIFGHTHRAGPLPADDGDEWIAPTGSRILNTGCWVLEPAFVGRHPAESPYRPGFAVTIDGDAPPALVNLLDG